MSKAKILAIRNFSADLFEINLRKILRIQNYSEVVIAGDYETIRRVPKLPGFASFQLERPISLKSIQNLHRFIREGSFDGVFYGSNDENGVGAILMDLFILMFPWKEIHVAHRLEIRMFQSRAALLGSLLLKIFWIPSYFLRKPASYTLRFSDDLLSPERPVHFCFKGDEPPLLKKTVGEETRGCFQLSSEKSIELPLTNQDGIGVVMGVAGEIQKKQEGVLELSIWENGVQTSFIKQETETLLPGWNDHELRFEKRDQSNNTVLKCELQNSKEDIFLSFPLLQKKLSQKNVIVIILDGVNKNYLGTYKPEACQYSPNIDEFFRNQFQYQSVFSQEIWTRPTFASMATSYYPSHHRLADKNFLMELPQSKPTLAEELRKGGFHTAAYVSHRLANQLYGFSRGFDRFVWRQTNEKPSFNARDITYFALETLAQNKSNNLFLFLHYFDTHWPFFPKSPYCYYGRQKDFRNASEVYLHCKHERKFSDDDRALITQTAQNKVREIDRILEPLLQKLKSKDYFENTSVILTSDHGAGRLYADAVLEGGILRLVDEIVEIPLLVSVAGNLTIDRSQTKRNQLVEGSVDFYPSVLELAGVHAPHSPYSQSYISSENLNGEKNYAISEAIYFDTYQLIARTQEEQYYLKCKKPTGSFQIDSNDVREGEGQTGDQEFKRIREELGLAEYNQNPSTIRENVMQPVNNV